MRNCPNMSSLTVSNYIFTVPLTVLSVALLGEVAFYITGLRHLSMMNKFYAEEPAAVEDFTFVAFVLCTRTLVVAWGEIAPLRAAVSILPLWVAFLAQPHVSLVFRSRVSLCGLFFSWLAYVIYQNNREMFVTQVV